MQATIENFKLPRYNEIPDVGLYLEQVVKYINTSLEPLGCMEITSSMVSNYVKHNYIERPVKKQYSREQIAYLIFIAVIKNVLSMDNILSLFEMQKRDYPAEIAYDYFCNELERMLYTIFGLDKHSGDSENNDAMTLEGKKMLRSAVIATAHIIYLSDCFAKRSK